MEGFDAETMNDDSPVDIARLLIFVQGAIAVTMTLEAAIGGLLAGPAVVFVVVPTLVAAILTLWLARSVGRRSRRARRLVVIIEVMVVLLALVDLLLAIVLAQRSLELVPILTRLVLPLAIIRLLRRPVSRMEFGMKPRKVAVVARG